MKKILTPRATGKTHSLIVESAKTGSYIVCANKIESERIKQRARELELSIPQPITYSEFLRKQYYGAGIKGFLIDNADRLLQAMTPVPVHTITMNP